MPMDTFRLFLETSRTVRSKPASRLAGKETNEVEHSRSYFPFKFHQGLRRSGKLCETGLPPSTLPLHRIYRDFPRVEERAKQRMAHRIDAISSIDASRGEHSRRTLEAPESVFREEKGRWAIAKSGKERKRKKKGITENASGVIRLSARKVRGAVIWGGNSRPDPCLHAPSGPLCAMLKAILGVI